MTDQFNTILIFAQKIFAFSGACLYFIFAVVVVKQVVSMTKNVYDKFNSLLIVFSYVHLLFSFFLLLATLIVLLF